MDRKVLIGSLIVITALVAGYAFQASSSSDQVGELDMTCGFSSDFAAFLQKCKKLFTKITRNGISPEVTSSVLPLEEKLAALIKL